MKRLHQFVPICRLRWVKICAALLILICVNPANAQTEPELKELAHELYDDTLKLILPSQFSVFYRALGTHFRRDWDFCPFRTITYAEFTKSVARDIQFVAYVDTIQAVDPRVHVLRILRFSGPNDIPAKVASIPFPARLFHNTAVKGNYMELESQLEVLPIYTRNLNHQLHELLDKGQSQKISGVQRVDSNVTDWRQRFRDKKVVLWSNLSPLQDPPSDEKFWKRTLGVGVQPKHITYVELPTVMKSSNDYIVGVCTLDRFLFFDLATGQLLLSTVAYTRIGTFRRKHSGWNPW